MSQASIPKNQFTDTNFSPHTLIISNKVQSNSALKKKKKDEKHHNYFLYLYRLRLQFIYV